MIELNILHFFGQSPATTSRQKLWQHWSNVSAGSGLGSYSQTMTTGRNGILAFTDEVKELGVCIAFVGTVLRTYTMDKILDVVEMIK